MVKNYNLLGEVKVWFGKCLEFYAFPDMTRGVHTCVLTYVYKVNGVFDVCINVTGIVTAHVVYALLPQKEIV